MGAFGPGSFENDDALDFAAELEASGAAALSEVLERAVGGDGVRDAGLGAAALAAAEVVAALAGRPSGELPDEVKLWVADAGAGAGAGLAAGGVEKLLGLARRALAVVTGGDAELAMLPPYGADGHDIANDRAGWDLWGARADLFLGRASPAQVAATAERADTAQAEMSAAAVLPAGDGR